MTNDEWITSALTDDMVVVELLFRLKQHYYSSSSSHSSHPPFPVKPPPPTTTTVLPPVGWGHRQPRSNLVTARKDSTRFSPTTPLSWSAGAGGSTSPSDGGSDESSLPSDPSPLSRSKVPFTKETNTISITNARSGKRKTFIELKEEESLLLNESGHLKKELPSVRVTLKEQRFRNQNLKRIKLDLNIQSANKIGAISDEPDATFSKQCSEMEECSLDCVHSILPRHATPEDVSTDSSRVQKDVKGKEISCFTLPDLNMPANEEETGTETPYGTS